MEPGSSSLSPWLLRRRRLGLLFSCWSTHSRFEDLGWEKTYKILGPYSPIHTGCSPTHQVVSSCSTTGIWPLSGSACRCVVTNVEATMILAGHTSISIQCARYVRYIPSSCWLNHLLWSLNTPLSGSPLAKVPVCPSTCNFRARRSGCTATINNSSIWNNPILPGFSVQSLTSDVLLGVIAVRKYVQWCPFCE